MCQQRRGHKHFDLSQLQAHRYVHAIDCELIVFQRDLWSSKIRTIRAHNSRSLIFTRTVRLYQMLD